MFFSVIALVVVNFSISIYAVNTLSEQIEQMGRHPVPVSRAAADVDVYLSQFMLQAQRLEFKHTDGDIQLAENLFNDIDSRITPQLTRIRELYSVEPSQADVLVERYAILRNKQSELLELCRVEDVSIQKIDSYSQEFIDPAFEEVQGITRDILTKTGLRFGEFQASARRIHVYSILISTVMLATILYATFVFYKAFRQKENFEMTMREGLQTALQDAQHANTAKSRFLANMSHDLRTPLNAIVGMTAIAASHLDNHGRVTSCLDKITASSHHLLGLINDILDMGKIENGKLQLVHEQISLPEWIQRFIAIIMPQGRARQLDVAVFVGDIERETVLGDVLRLNQILLNIMGNAIKFTPPGGRVSLRITEEPCQRPNHGLYRFVIEDNGIGMPAEFLEKIWEPFERAHNSTVNRTEGTGLGMTITKNIVSMMGGDIRVESEEGKGTRFTVSLPLEWGKQEFVAFPSERMRELRVLIVDGDEEVCERTARILDEFGVENAWVQSGEDAVEAAIAAMKIRQEFRAIIMAWKLPGIDGAEAARRIRESTGAETPAILLTAYDWTEIEAEADAAGVTAFLAKPLFPSRLYAMLTEIADGHIESSPSKKESMDSPQLHGRVLVVEDNPLNMEIAGEILSMVGVDHDKAWDGAEAVEAVRLAPEGFYQLVFMDVHMPKMDGYSATQKIREYEEASDRARVPIIALSANAFAEDRTRATEAGMDGYLVKPFGVEDLKAILKRYLR